MVQEQELDAVVGGIRGSAWRFCEDSEGFARGLRLVSVPKTPQAQDAILLASVPHKTTIDISKAKVSVTYSGQPQFAAIEGTSLKYAANSPYAGHHGRSGAVLLLL